MLLPVERMTHMPSCEAVSRKPFPKDTLDRLRDFLAGREAEPEPDAEPADPEPPLPE